MGLRKRIVPGGYTITRNSEHGGPPITETFRDPKPRKEPAPKCRTCWDSGRVATEPVDPDDPWAAPIYEDCPRGCERKP